MTLDESLPFDRFGFKLPTLETKDTQPNQNIENTKTISNAQQMDSSNNTEKPYKPSSKKNDEKLPNELVTAFSTEKHAATKEDLNREIH